MNLALQKTTLREMLARSAVFQTAIGAAGTDEEKITAAKEKIFLSAVRGDSIVRPCAIIYKNKGDRLKAIGGGESQQFIQNGNLEIQFEKTIPDDFLNDNETDIEAGQEGNAEDDFEEFYQGCIAEINALAGSEGYLFIRGWELLEGPSIFQSSGNQKLVYFVRMRCNWGIE